MRGKSLMTTCRKTIVLFTCGLPTAGSEAQPRKGSPFGKLETCRASAWRSHRLTSFPPARLRLARDTWLRRNSRNRHFPQYNGDLTEIVAGCAPIVALCTRKNGV